MSSSDDMAEVLIQGTLEGFAPEEPKKSEIPPVQAGPGYGARLKSESEGPELTAEYKAREALRGAKQNSEGKSNVIYPGWARRSVQVGWQSVREGIKKKLEDK